jgi:hypothetical protein
VRPFVFAFAAAVFAQTACGATLSSYTSKEGKQIIILNGELAPGDLDQLQNLIKEANSAGRLVSGIRLNSPGGSLLEGVKLAGAIRFGKIATVVPNGQTCASACFIAFAAGGEKYASYSASIGVHGASDKSGKESGDGTIAMAKIVRELGVPPAIIGKMVVTPPEQMVWLGPNDLRAIGATMTGKPSQVAAPEPLGIPSQIPPSAQASKPPGPVPWPDMVEAAAKASSSQNNGRPQLVRVCQPELKICNNGISYVSKDGKKMILRTAEDLAGKTIEREICEFNQFGDVRSCLNWDTGVTTKGMKNEKGDWISVERN